MTKSICKRQDVFILIDFVFDVLTVMKKNIYQLVCMSLLRTRAHFNKCLDFGQYVSNSNSNLIKAGFAHG